MLLIILAVALYVFIKGLIRHSVSGYKSAQRGAPRSPAPEADEMVQDPCCKVYVPLSRSVRVFSGGQTLHFCSEDCARKYSSGQGCG